MFTGLIREIAKVISFENNTLTIKASYKPQIGDSISVNGACLTVVKVSKDTFSAEVSFESKNILSLNTYLNEVHIEPAMMMGDRFDGHIVQGHIDCQGIIKSIKKNGNSVDFIISMPQEYFKYIIPKGSIAIDGVSLTINEVLQNEFRLTIIPHTIENTILRNYKIGTKVNIETDMFARYIFNVFNKNDNTLDWDIADRILYTY